MSTLCFLLSIFIVGMLIHRVLNIFIFRPPRQVDDSDDRDDNDDDDDNATIRSGTQHPKLEDLAQDVEYEEVKDDDKN